jgi:hypothetical protein
LLEGDLVYSCYNEFTSNTKGYRRQDALCQKGTEHDMNQGFQKMTTNLAGPLQTLTQQMQEVRDDVSARQARSDVAACRLLRQAAGTKKHLVTANRNSLRQHNKTRQQMIQGNTKVVDVICSKIQDLPGNLAQINLSTRKSGREVRFIENSQQAILSPPTSLEAGASVGHFSHAFSPERAGFSTGPLLTSIGV